MKKLSLPKSVLIVAILCLMIAIVWFGFRYKYKQYNPFWIKGKTIEEIEARYGEAERVGTSNIYLYDLGQDKSFVMSTNERLYLYMKTNESNVVTEMDVNIYKMLRLKTHYLQVMG